MGKHSGEPEDGGQAAAAAVPPAPPAPPAPARPTPARASTVPRAPGVPSPQRPRPGARAARPPAKDSIAARIAQRTAPKDPQAAPEAAPAAEDKPVAQPPRTRALPTPEQRVPHSDLMLKLAGGITVTVVAWGFLVAQAISFGTEARDGQGSAWVFLFLATVGATACLFLTIILGSRLHRLLKGEELVKATKITGGRRASR